MKVGNLEWELCIHISKLLSLLTENNVQALTRLWLRNNIHHFPNLEAKEGFGEWDMLSWDLGAIDIRQTIFVKDADEIGLLESIFLVTEYHHS